MPDEKNPHKNSQHNQHIQSSVVTPAEQHLIEQWEKRSQQVESNMQPQWDKLQADHFDALRKILDAEKLNNRDSFLKTEREKQALNDTISTRRDILVQQKDAALDGVPNAEAARQLVEKQVAALLPELEKLGYRDVLGDKHGHLTLEQVEAGMAKDFNRHLLYQLDNNKDGNITLQELTTHLPPLNTPASAKPAPHKGK